MKRPVSIVPVLLFIFIFFQSSCKQEDKKSVEKNEPDAPTQTQLTHSKEARVFTTQSGKTFELIEFSNEDGLYDFFVVPKGFEFSRDTLAISGADPMSEVFIADLDENGFEEIYMITSSVGSGSYGNIYAYSSNNDKSVSPIYLPPISEKDLLPEGVFAGYMGHDSIYLDQGRLMRKFPIYLEGDPNCCPTGGHRTVEYQLVPGEAGWILKLQTP